ncbi:hypothetical protein ACFSBZ_01290 [Amnibacterium flavum]|uniref:hypothetical protein n=1 Tax=Amnibacterium flavum TaxID=2173173 RepID=UPI00196B17CE|nr:hypothetical protein [Amnibacterium flavum]
MAPVHGTTIAVVGPEAQHVLSSLDRFAGVDAMALADADSETAAKLIATSDATYVVHDVDPLRHVAAAWVEFFDDQSTAEVLDLEVEAAVSRLVSGEAFMPDYYVVIEPASLEGTWRHWWLGALAHLAPMRVLPMEASASSVRGLLRSLPTSRPWPAPDAWLPSLKFAVPDAWLPSLKFAVPDHVGLNLRLSA